MVNHICRKCNFNTTIKSNYNRHILSKKHLENIQQIDINNNNNNNNNTIMFTIVENQQSLSKQNEDLRKEIEKLKEINNINTNKIVKEARAIKKSILTILNTNFKDTPSIDYINEDDFKKELELEYKAKITNKDDRLFMRIFNDYENKKIIKTLSDLILKFVKKNDQKTQSVFNIDSARGNYATKIEDFWHNDKNGLQLKKYTLDVIIGYMMKVMDVFRQRLSNMHAENKTKRDISVTDYIMKYQAVLFEVNAYLTNSNTHKKIILHMCPELRMDQHLLETLDNEL